MISMKLWILCKYNNSRNPNEDDLAINCGICKGMDTLNSIKVILEEYCDEIEDIIYPECNILKNILNKNMKRIL